MSTNAIRELLEGVAATGELPTEADIAAALPSTSSASGRAGDKRGLLTAARKVRALRGPHSESDDPAAEIDEVIAGVEEKFSPGLAGRMADQVRGARDNSTAAIEQRRQQAQRQRKTVEPLVEILKLAGPAGGVDMAEVDQLALRDDVTAEQRQQFRTHVAAAAKRVSTVHRSGAQGPARQIAEQAANELGGVLAPVVHRDPHGDLDDPHELANVIRNRQTIGG